LPALRPEEARVIRNTIRNVSSSRRLRRTVAGATGAIVLGLAACGGGDEEGGGASGTIVFGANTQLSGSLQVYGLPAEQGARLGAEAINADGGIEVDGETYEMKATAQDNQSNPSQVVSAARAVVDSGAIAALGPDLGAVPSYEVLTQNDIITFTPAFDLQAQLMEDPEGNPLLFSPTVFLAELAVMNMRQIKSLFPDIERVAIMAPNDEQGQANAAGYEFAAEQVGLTVVGKEAFPVSATDFTSILTKFKGENPDLLIAEQSVEHASAIIQQAVELGVASYALNDVMTPDQAQQIPGVEKIPVIIPNFSPTYSPNATIPDYDPEAIFGDEKPAGNPGAAIDMWYAVRLFAQAIEEAGTVEDTAAIAKALPAQSYDGPFGTCTMSERRELDCETIVDVVRGDKITVYRFPSPDSVKPSETYVCRGGDCQPE
jgi:branched-chain amino acid transport system substrate-binding protein